MGLKQGRRFRPQTVPDIGEQGAEEMTIQIYTNHARTCLHGEVCFRLSLFFAEPAIFHFLPRFVS
jgi:hypothetical protein